MSMLNCDHAWHSGPPGYDYARRKVLAWQICVKCGARRSVPITGLQAIRMRRFFLSGRRS